MENVKYWAATAWALAGWKVLPVEVIREQETWIERPLVKEEASRDHDQIKCWWAQYPEAQIGGIHPGYLAIDIDAGYDLKGLPPTETHFPINGATRRIYKCAEIVGNNLAPQIHIRIVTSLIVLPPSDGYGPYDEHDVVEFLPEHWALLSQPLEKLVAHVPRFRGRDSWPAWSELDSQPLPTKPFLDSQIPLNHDPFFSTETELAKAALDYARHGFAVFPCWPGTKVPACPNGFKAATTDTAQIVQWWTQTPDANIGTVPAQSGHLVLDLDRGHDPSDVMGLPQTLHTQTPSGGTHLWFTTDQKLGNRAFAPHIDVRSANGYVLVPPSIIDARDAKAAADPTRCGHYVGKETAPAAPVPQRVLEKLRANPDRALEKFRANPDRASSDPVSEYRLREVLSWLDPECENTVWFSHLGSIISTPLIGDEDFAIRLRIAREWSAGKLDRLERYALTSPSKYKGDDDVDERLNRLDANKPGGAGFGSLVHAAREAGMGPGPNSADPAARFSEAAGVARDQIIEGLNRKKENTSRKDGNAPNRFGGRTPEEDATLPPMTYWDRNGLLPRGPFVGIVYGLQGVHKTGLFILHGLDAIERHDAHVLYIAAEGAFGIRTSRLPKAREARGMEWARLNKSWRTEPETFSLLQLADHEWLYAAHHELAPDLIFIDVLTKIAAGDINTPDVASRIMTAANNLALRFDATVVISHHPGKDPDRGAMGSYLLEALADFMWLVTKQDNQVWVKVRKMKDGPTDHAHPFGIDWSLGAPVLHSLESGSEVLDPLTVSIRKLLHDHPDKKFNMSDLIEDLRAREVLSDLKKPEAKIAGLVQGGELAAYVTWEGEGKQRRYTFAAPSF